MNPENLKLEFDPEWEKKALSSVEQWQVWAEKELEKAKCTASPGCGYFETTCPACGQHFQVAGKTPRPLRRALRNHMLSSPPSGIEYALMRVGDRLWFDSDLYELFAGPFRPLALAGRSGYEKVHTFFIIVRRLKDGRFFRTYIKKPNMLREIDRPITCEIGWRRRIPHFRIVDRRQFFLFDTDDPALAALAYDRLLDLDGIHINLDPDKELEGEFDQLQSKMWDAERDEMKKAKINRKRFEKAFSIGMRRPWPPQSEEFGDYQFTFNIIDADGRALFSSDDFQEAATFWKTDPNPRSVGLVISGNFSEPEELALQLFRFKDEAGLLK